MTDPQTDARIAALEAAVNELRDRLDRPHGGSMAQTLRCPACRGTKILHFSRIKDIAHNQALDMSLQKEFSVWWGVKLSAGALEVFACKRCRLVEWHAVTLDDVVPDGQDVVELTGAETADKASGPYR